MRAGDTPLILARSPGASPVHGQSADGSLRGSSLQEADGAAEVRTFKLWAAGDAHLGTDLAHADRRSLADAILQAERGGADGGPPFEWDIMLDIGDLSGSQTPPGDEEGEEVVRQYSVSTRHPREDFYNIVGNHDASGPDEP